MKTTPWFLGLLLWSLAANSHSQMPIETSNREAYVGAGYQRLQYTEYMDGTFADSEIGRQATPAVIGGGSWQGSVLGLDRVYAAGEYSFARGKTSYNGFLFSLQDPSFYVPYQSSTDIETTDFQLRLGKGFANAQDDGMLTPYIAVGHHHWERNSAATDPHGYLENYHHSFAGVGVLAQGTLAPRWVASVEVNAGVSFGAHITAPQFGLSQELGSERVLGIGLGLDYAVTRWFHMKLAFEDTNFRYRQSQVQNGLLEPDSTTIQSTTMLLFAFSY
jgi:hypothetical protein